MQTSLYNEKAAGKTVKTAFGNIAFDEKGYAVADLDEKGKARAKALGWLVAATAPKKARLLMLAERRDKLEAELRKVDEEGRALSAEIEAEERAAAAAAKAEQEAAKKVAEGKADELAKKQADEKKAEPKVVEAKGESKKDKTEGEKK